MKILTLLRHAKSAWDDPVQRDYDRPLNPRGRRAARTVGREMKALGLSFDSVIASPARRVRETLDEVAAVFGDMSPRFDERLYLASARTLLNVAHEGPDAVERLMLVGHNPGLEELALRLAAPGAGPLRDEVELKYPTGTLAQIELPAARWSEVREGTGRLVRFIRPRDLDPELGPDGS
jgi:phosphohistidine phosphatase